MKLLVLGVSGMLGSQFFKTSLERGCDVIGVARDVKNIASYFNVNYRNRFLSLNDVKDFTELEQIIIQTKPDYVVNCIGIIKQSHLSEDFIESITINSLLPHKLGEFGLKYNFKLIHISTDCVFDGRSGNYKESDFSSAYDLYGKSKFLGEISYGCGITLRTSIIGHEISNNTHGLIEWFLKSSSPIKGYDKAIFSGLTTFELSNIILEKVIPCNLSSGLYHLSVNPINKFELLTIVNELYGLKKEIIKSNDLVIDRSLNSSFFRKLVNYEIPSWQSLIEQMRDNRILKVN